MEGKRRKKKQKTNTEDPLIIRHHRDFSNNTVQTMTGKWFFFKLCYFQATKVAVPNDGKQYTTYSFQMVLVKSQCDAKVST